MRPRTTLDLGAVLLWLLLSALAISAIDTFETYQLDNGTVSLAPWSEPDPSTGAFDLGYFAIRNSVRRWLFGYLPLLSLAGGILVGLICSSPDRAWLLAIPASALVSTTALALLALSPALGAVVAAVDTTLTMLAAVVVARITHRRRRGG